MLVTGVFFAHNLNMKNNVQYIFGKDLTKHLETIETNERYLDLRITRFSEEFLASDKVTFEQIEILLKTLEDYLDCCLGAAELDYCLLNLRQSIYWLAQYSEADYE